jgi:hypothetical protein
VPARSDELARPRGDLGRRHACAEACHAVSVCARIRRTDHFDERRAAPSRLARQPHVDLAIDEAPLFRLAQPTDQLLERPRLLWVVLEPCDEVERLAELARMVQAPRYGRQIVEADPDVTRARFDDRAALVLCQRPPCLGLTDRNQGRTRCGRTAQPFLS